MINNIFNAEEFLKTTSEEPIPMDASKPRFILIVPPSAQIPTPGREFFLRTPMEGVSFISTVLKNAGYKVEIVDFRTGEKPIEDIIKDNNIIGIATFADSYIFVEDFINKVREKNKKITVILGGSFISSSPELLMKNLSADYAVLGEGELTILELMRVLAKGNKDSIPEIPGLCYKQEGKVFFSRPRSQMHNLDSLPLLDFNPWQDKNNDLCIEKLGFSSSRGCHNNCSFCFKTIPDVCLMSPVKFGAALKYFAKKHKLGFVFINDLNFVFDEKRTIQLCRELKESGMKWACSMRVDNINAGLLEIMSNSGCREIWYGFESVDQDVLDANFKRITVAQIEKAVELTNKAGIKVMGNFIVGLLGETENSLNKMIKFIEAKDVIPCSIKYLTPFPGTYIYRYAKKNGWIKDEIEYFRSLSRRKVNYEDDEIINCTGLAEYKLREAFKKIRQISYDRYGSLDWHSDYA